MSLIKYQRKREFKKTSEPKGANKTKSQNRFVVQKHSASHFHYDFRLELPDKINSGPVVLKSWAVPKGIPEIAGIKHLAVAVEDHPVDYINFKGVIPAGNYGAGMVEIWDKGKFKLIDFSKNFLKIELKGKRLTGIYILVKLRTENKNWLIFKVSS